ncbi:MAG: D-tyrosyl-tRNA(Tyr) deacylase [Pseudomonadales bacterium]|nr:D-tyrosyl-tRNA(Tyr) deacylase [Pseudomonadales bacterium]
MLGLIQRVSSASVVVDGQIIGAIDQGILLMLGVQKTDDESLIEKLVKKVFAYRIFGDEKGHMNLSLTDVNGGLLIVPQFTIAASTKKGLRPSFSSAAAPEIAKKIYDQFVAEARLAHPNVATGKFGADMKVSLLNDGPVTFMLEAN